MSTEHNAEQIREQMADETLLLTHGNTEYSKAFFNLRMNFPTIHPAVYKAFDYAPPLDMRMLVMEWPHVAQTDAARLAYTRDEKAMLVDRQTVTSVGKYLRRHFSSAALPDHIIRDLCALTQPNAMRIVRTLPEIIRHVIDGPRSCMSGSNFDVPDEHPYRVYDPDLGWGLAVRTDAHGSTVGRCLVYKSVDPDDADKPGRFVRSYKREDNGYSTADEGLEAWLREQGYIKDTSWEDAYLRWIPMMQNGQELFVAPYLDGNVQRVDIDSRMLRRLVITDNGEYECDNTNGLCSAPGEPCEDCGDAVRDDTFYVGIHEDRMVCSGCADSHYTYAYTYRGWTRRIPDDNVIEVNGEYYDIDYLSDNDIVCLHDGDYANESDAVYIDRLGEWYLSDSAEVVYLPDGEAEHIDACVQLDSGEWCLRDEAWECADTGNWYANDHIAPVIIDGETYHPNSNFVLESKSEETIEE